MITPLLIYDNADLFKLRAVSENRGKSGVYRWINKINGKSYIGSSVNLGKRLGNYYNLNTISTGDMLIYKALIKYGYSNFSLEILEYCDRSDTLSREQYYLDLCEPEYNILKIAGSNLGYIHSENTLAKMRESRLNLTEEQKAKLREHLEKHNASVEQREKSRQRLIDYNKSKGVTIEILDATTNKISSYSSIREASEALGCVHGTILLAERRQREGITKLIKKRYLIKNIQRREVHSLAHMGDGYFADGCLKICTDNFTKDEVLRLIAVLRKKFDIKATINQRINSDGSVKWRIRVSKLSMDKLVSLVRPHIIPEMLYKLGLK